VPDAQQHQHDSLIQHQQHLHNTSILSPHAPNC
jgi:hypothetical protein